MNIFDDAHLTYLTSHHLGRLATIAPDGTPQNKAVGYRYNPEHQTIDIAGFGMGTLGEVPDNSAPTTWWSRRWGGPNRAPRRDVTGPELCVDG